MLGGFLKKQLNKYSGKKDFLEACVASGIIIAASEGGISDEEAGSLVETLTGMESLTSAYSTSEIEEVIEAYIKRSKTTVGRAGLLRELDDVAKKDIQMREDVYLVALEVAGSDGNIGPQEREALKKVASRLSVQAEKFEAA